MMSVQVDPKTPIRPGANKRPAPMEKDKILPWLVQFAQLDVEALASGRPGDLPNLLYDLSRWLDLSPDEPQAKEVAELAHNLERLQQLVDRIAELLGAVADRKRFETRYQGGKVILEADKLQADGGRALSYWDARLEDAVIRVALDDIYENSKEALKIRRCAEQSCGKLFFAGRLNQIYCSHRCANKVASKKYRETHREERAAQERARYRRRFPPSLKVRRRNKSS